MSPAMLSELLHSLWQTIYMVGVSSMIASLLGIPLGVLLITTRDGGILSNPTINSMTSALVNGLRSIPFIILLVAFSTYFSPLNTAIIIEIFNISAFVHIYTFIFQSDLFL